MGWLSRWQERRDAARIADADDPSTGVHIFPSDTFKLVDAEAYMARALLEGFEAGMATFPHPSGGGSWRVYVRRAGESWPLLPDEPGWTPTSDLDLPEGFSR